MLPFTMFKKSGFIAAFAGSAIILSLCVGTILQSTPAVADEASLEQRLQRAEDEKQIRDLMVLYGQYLDRLDFASYSQLFAREGEWGGQLSGPTTIKGPDNIRTAMEKAFAERTYDPDHITNMMPFPVSLHSPRPSNTRLGEINAVRTAPGFAMDFSDSQ